MPKDVLDIEINTLFTEVGNGGGGLARRFSLLEINDAGKLSREAFDFIKDLVEEIGVGGGTVDDDD